MNSKIKENDVSKGFDAGYVNYLVTHIRPGRMPMEIGRILNNQYHSGNDLEVEYWQGDLEAHKLAADIQKSYQGVLNASSN